MGIGKGNLAKKITALMDEAQAFMIVDEEEHAATGSFTACLVWCLALRLLIAI